MLVGQVVSNSYVFDNVPSDAYHLQWQISIDRLNSLVDDVGVSLTCVVCIGGRTPNHSGDLVAIEHHRVDQAHGSARIGANSKKMLEMTTKLNHRALLAF